MTKFNGSIFLKNMMEKRADIKLHKQSESEHMEYVRRDYNQY